MSVPLSELLLEQNPTSMRATEVHIDPALPHVSPDQRAQALDTARDVATETLHARDALPSQSLECLCAFQDWRGRLCRLAFHPRMTLVRMAIVIAAVTIPIVATGAGPLQIYAAIALAAALSVTADNLVHRRVDQANENAIEAEAHNLLTRAGLSDVLPTRSTS